MSIKDITVVIAAFKSKKKIKNCLNSIDDQVSVLVVENSNDLEMKNNIEKEFKNTKCILAGSNIGYGSPNNIALKIVKTKYVLILNPDTKLHPSVFENFLKAVEEAPDFAIMAPYIQDNEKKKNYQNLKNLSPIKVLNVRGFAMFLNLNQF